MHLFGIKTCDTCRKALKLLRDVEFVDVRDAGVPTDIMDRAVAQFGDALINRRSTTWRTMDDATRGRSTRAPVEVLREHPTLMKRPLIEANGVLYLGWDADVHAALVG